MYDYGSICLNNAWICLNVTEYAWINCSDYGRVLNIPWYSYNNIIVTNAMLEFLSARFIHPVEVYLFLTWVKTRIKQSWGSEYSSWKNFLKNFELLTRKFFQKFFFRVITRKVKFLIFHFWVTNSKLENKGFYFKLLPRSWKTKISTSSY